MLTLRGARALSEARIARILARARARGAPLEALGAVHVHFVDLAAPLAPAERERLERLLDYGPRGEALLPEGTRLWVVPRLGTISPWSSKATDIAHLCGLAAVRRIERGGLHGGVRITGPAPAPFERLRGEWRFQLLLRAPSGAAVRRAVAAALGDRPAGEISADVDPYHLL